MKTSCKRLLCLVLCLLMIVSCIPIAGAEGNTTSQTTTDGLLAEKATSTRDGTDSHKVDDNTISYEKQVKLDDDGTYTFQLESYVTGAVTPQPVPLDIVLVLDQSTSMVNNIMTEVPSSVYIKYFSELVGKPYSEISEYSMLIYLETIEKEVDGEVTTQVVHRRAKVKRTADASAKGIFSEGGSLWQTNISNCSNTITTANSKKITLDGYHYTGGQVNFKLARNSSNKYYYVNASNSSEKTGTFSTAQEAFDYVRTTYWSENYSDYKVALFDNGDGTVHSDVTFYIPISYFRWISPQYTITYYRYDDTTYSDPLGEVIDAQMWTAETPTEPDGYTDEICRTNALRYFTREDALQNAALDFIVKMQDIAKQNNADHRIAVVGFGNGKDGTNSDGSKEGTGGAYKGTELLSTETEINYANATTSDYRAALQSVNVDGNLNPLLETAIDRIQGNGATFLEYGLKMAKSVLDSRPEEDKYYSIGNRQIPRKTLVIIFTDGVPGFYDVDSCFIDYTSCGPVQCANRAITEAKRLKDDGVTVYTIGMVEGANPSTSYNFSANYSTKINSPLGVSTTYKGYTTKAQAINAFLHFLSSDYPNATSMLSETRTTVVNNGYYYAALSAEDLDQAFTNISENVAVSTVELTADAVVRDVMAEGFDLPVDIESDPGKYVQTFTSDYLGNDQWGELVPTDKCFITVNRATKTVDVTNFDYQKHYVHEAYDGNNGQTVPAGGKRLVITIHGVTANDEAIQNALVNTNDPSSGIYTGSGMAAELVAPFEVPTEYLQKKIFVLDYFMPTEIPCVDVGVFTPLHLSATGMTGFADRNTTIECANGRVVLEDGILYCIPTNSDFHETNHFYLYGLDANGENVWSKISFLPANNVFYEDDWATYSDNWSVDGVANGNTETLSNPVHGYIESKANEQGYSNGSAHYSATPGSYAEFTFSGTGIDIYCRTDETCGVSLALLTPEGEELATKYFMVDNESTSDTYYQTPTVFFHDLTYGTYSLKIIVVENESRNHYYLDGFRVYNPLQVDDEITKLAYGAEYHSDYTTVRNLLINPTDSITANITGAFFIDEVTDEEGNGSSTNSNAIETYVDFGPKNEVYLSSGNSIVLKADTNAYYYVGIKAPAGSATVSYSYGTTAEGEDARKEVTINSAADLYYEVIPSAEGYIEIKNLSGGIISLTKLRSCGNEKGLALRSASAAEILDYANRFDSLREATEHTFTAPTYTKAPKQAKLLFRKIKKPIIGRETQ